MTTASRVSDSRVTDEMVNAFRAHVMASSLQWGELGRRLGHNQMARDIRTGLEAALPQHVALVESHCPYCDDTGDVHSIDGEWRGECACGAAQFNRLHEIAYRDEAKSVTVRADDLRAVLTALIAKANAHE